MVLQLLSQAVLLGVVSFLTNYIKTFEYFLLLILPAKNAVGATTVVKLSSRISEQ